MLVLVLVVLVLVEVVLVDVVDVDELVVEVEVVDVLDVEVEVVVPSVAQYQVEPLKIYHFFAVVSKYVCPAAGADGADASVSIPIATALISVKCVDIYLWCRSKLYFHNFCPNSNIPSIIIRIVPTVTIL